MAIKVFIDGKEGTTGLKIFERFANRSDLEILEISEEKRKDPVEKAKMINASDYTFLCLPDAAAVESAQLCTNPDTVIIDASTAHRTNPAWAYGFPELSESHRAAIKGGKRIAVPGCYASGFISLVYPLVAGGILPKDYPVSSFALSGYSGAGKNTIAVYEGEDRPAELSSGREYALTQQHKHLKEMKKITGIERTPLFSPIIDDYYSGMVVSVPLFADMLAKKETPESLLAFYADYYKDEKFIQVSAADDEVAASGFLAGNGLSGWDGLKIYVTGNTVIDALHLVVNKLKTDAELAKEHYITIEYGIESTYDSTLKSINRGHDFACAERAVRMSAERGLAVGAHFVLGLPGETDEMILEQVQRINALPLTTVKFHQLQVFKGTTMEREYDEHPEHFRFWELEEYLDLFVEILRRLRPDIVVERFASEAPPRYHHTEGWGLVRNEQLLAMLDKRLEERGVHQGEIFDIFAPKIGVLSSRELPNYLLNDEENSLYLAGSGAGPVSVRML